MRNGFSYSPIKKIRRNGEVMLLGNFDTLKAAEEAVLSQPYPVYEYAIFVYRDNKLQGHLLFNPHIGWWNVGQWPDMELMV